MLEVFQRVPDPFGRGDHGDGPHTSGDPVGGGAYGGVVELLFHGRTAFQTAGRAASMSWRSAP